jgi:phosphate transport system protein
MMTRSRFEAELAQIRSDLLAMGFETEGMLRDAVAALVGANSGDPTADIIRRDDVVDALEDRLETSCIQVLAIQQPVVASDLRFITTVMKVATDVERIGDHAVNIAKTVGRMRAAGVWYRPLVDINRLGDMACRMLHDALEALVHRDTERAQAVIVADDAVDALYARMRTELQTAMQDDSVVVPLCSSLLFVVHYLERVSDHATNIAERLLFLETGQRCDKPRSGMGK